MGWNAGGTVVEAQIIGLYNKKLLTPEILDVIMEPFKETDCDTAGFYNLKADDGKDVYEIICMVMQPEKYKEVFENLVFTDDKCEQIFINSENGYDLWFSIWRGMWDIW